jgi:putative membrane protein
MNRFLARWLVNTIAIAVAMYVLNDLLKGQLPATPSQQDLVDYAPNLKTIAPVALIFGLINAFLKPVLKILSCPLRLLTMGLFTFVINAGLLLLTSNIAQRLGLDFKIDGFVPALVGSIVISVISLVLSIFIPDE